MRSEVVDTDLLLIKAGKVRNHVKRAREKCDRDLAAFLSDRDHQDIVCFNLQVAIQNCIDIAAHVMSDQETIVTYPKKAAGKTVGPFQKTKKPTGGADRLASL